MKTSITLLIFMFSIFAKASDLKISTPILYNEGNSAYAIFNLSWNNSWNTSKNNDAVWLFFKSRSPERGNKHIKVLGKGHSVVNSFSDNLDLGFEVSKDGMGLFLYPQNEFRGRVEVTLKVILDRNSFKEIDPINWYFTAHGIEMVHIPEGGFVLGDPNERAMEYGAFYKPNTRGKFESLVSISSESQKFEVREDGDLFYQAGEEDYEGDQLGPIPSTYPKGVSAFHIMKYELSEGQYARFLNNLSETQRAEREIIKEKNYSPQQGSISFQDGIYITEYPNKPCLFVGWDDAMAYADWSGLRPMTELEYVKAARGTSKPISDEMPWGKNSKEKMQRVPAINRTLVMVNGWDESQLNDTNRELFGASYYWVMDMAGSLWERVVTVGHPNGRSFSGQHGDGFLSENGVANVEDWPKGLEGSGGIGFRGGGFYGYDREYHEFNPFSPIAYRRYGGWHGAMRNNAYGTRFVRTR